LDDELGPDLTQNDHSRSSVSASMKSN